MDANPEGRTKMTHCIIFVLFFCFAMPAWALNHDAQSANVIQIEDGSGAKVQDNHFLSISELTEPEDFVGTIIVENGENGSEYFFLATEENDREVLIAVNNRHDPFYQTKELNAYQDMQGLLRNLVGRKVRIRGQLISGMRINNGTEEFVNMPKELDHLTFHWLRAINVEELK